MATSLKFFDEWVAGTLQNSVPANNNALRSEVLAANVISDATTAQPGSPADGDCYIIPASATGAQWVSFAQNSLAFFRSGTWYEFEPFEGLLKSVNGTIKVFDGSDWISSGGVGAALTQTKEFMSGFISAPANKDYRIVVNAAHGGTITETTTRSASGTCTATFKVNTTALGGTANSVSSTEQSRTHSSSNTFVAGDDIVITVSANSSCADMSFTVKYTRVLE
jgi:hypothetical protein